MRIPSARTELCLVCVLWLSGAFSVWAQKPAALPPGVVAQGDKYVSQSDGAEMIYIPPGEFVMGMPAGFWAQTEKWPASHSTHTKHNSVLAEGILINVRGPLLVFRQSQIILLQRLFITLRELL